MYSSGTLCTLSTVWLEPKLGAHVYAVQVVQGYDGSAEATSGQSVKLVRP